MNRFIELPDGTIINVANVRRVFQYDASTSLNTDDPSEMTTRIEFNNGDYHDYPSWPEYEVWDYFHSIAQQIEGV